MASGPSSGVTIDAECVKAFEDVKKHRLHKYVLFTLNDKRDCILVLKRADPDATYDNLVEDLLSNKMGCFAAYNCDVSLPNGRKFDKISLIYWMPEDSAVKNKMIYSSSKDSFTKFLQWSNKCYQANDQDDLRWDTFYKSVVENEVKN